VISPDIEKDIRPKGGVKAQPPREKKHWREILLGALNLESWTLKARFVWLTGVLLLMGNMVLIFFFYVTQSNNVENLSEERLRFLKVWVENELNQEQRFLLSQSAALTLVPSVRQDLAEKNVEGIQGFVTPYSEKIIHGAGISSLQFSFHTPLDNLFFQTGLADGGAQSPAARALAARAIELGRQTSGFTSSPSGIKLRAVTPVTHNDARAGSVTASVDLPEILRNMELPKEYGLTIFSAVFSPKPAAKDENAKTTPKPQWKALKHFGEGEPPDPKIAAGIEDGGKRLGDAHLNFIPLYDVGGRVVGGLTLSFNAAMARQHMWNSIALFALFFSAGAFILWLFLYINVSRIEDFLARLKKIIISSHSNYFAERFESDHVHCLDIMNCHNEECPVYQNPSLVCYLETGSEAISPKWRDTCIYLNKYQSCSYCPVYSMRKGDELTEMRNVVNTMMRLWSEFLNRVGRLLAYVLRSQDSGFTAPSLDDISERLEQMAKLTFFNHDLQGVLARDEVYRQLSFVMKENFSLRRFLIFEVNHDNETMTPSLDTTEDEPLCKKQLLLSSEACRAKRAAEDVISYFNPVICPHFNCNTDAEVRCCLPMTMGGQVGAVFSFVAGKRGWDRIRGQLPIIRKYLDESAPVLSSLSLLQLTKEQSLRDPLTGCHNRRFLDEFIAKYEPLTEREGTRTGFLMADLDFFKQVNDQYGHQAGDAVLTQAARILRNRVRRSDLLIRYGGEEFLVLLQNVQDETAAKVAENIRASLESYEFDIGDGRKIKKTISVGVAEYPTDARGLYQAIKFADVALYEAKRQGRNRVARFAPEMWLEEDY
jgi:diguanylate cyclase (GGDEF)-like protein